MSSTTSKVYIFNLIKAICWQTSKFCRFKSIIVTKPTKYSNSWITQWVSQQKGTLYIWDKVYPFHHSQTWFLDAWWINNKAKLIWFMVKVSLKTSHFFLSFILLRQNSCNCRLLSVSVIHSAIHDFDVTAVDGSYVKSSMATD